MHRTCMAHGALPMDHRGGDLRVSDEDPGATPWATMPPARAIPPV